MKLSRSEPIAVHPHYKIFVHGAKLDVVREKTLTMCIVWMMYSVGAGFSASTVACYRFALSVPLYPDVDRLCSILGKSIALFP